MSNPKQHQHFKFKEKLIQIKPVKQINPMNSVNESLETSNEKANIENQLEIMKAEIEQLKLEKEKLLQSTRQEISNEKKNWEQEKEELIKKGYEEGYHLGIAEGKQAAENQYNTLIEQANGLIETAKSDYHTTLDQSDHVIMDLSIKIAEKIIKTKINEEPEVFLRLITAAIQEIKDQSVISIYLHPNNYESVVKQKSELLNVLDGDTKLSIYIDQKMTENECLIEHPFGQIDASIDTQLQQIHDVLHQVTMEQKS